MRPSGERRLPQSGPVLRRRPRGCRDERNASRSRSRRARILTHRRDEHPIGKLQISNRERIKQAGHVSCRL